MRLADDSDEVRLNIADASADASSSRRKVSDSTIGKPPVRSSSVSAASSQGKTKMRRTSQPQVTNGQHKRSHSTRSHASQSASHDTEASSPLRSSPPFDDEDAVATQQPPVGTSSSSTSAISHMYASTTADSDSQHQHTGNTPSLARSGSGASTVPTSPETELAQSILRSASYDKSSASRSNESSVTSHLALSTKGDGTDSVAAPAEEPVPTPAQTDKGPKGPTPEAERRTNLNPLLHVLSRTQPPAKLSRAEKVYEDRANHPPRASLAHRNKPLPVPGEQYTPAASTGRSAQESATTSRNRVSSGTTQRKSEAGKGPSKVAEVPHTTTQASATPSRSTLKSMLTRSSSKLFRSSMHAERDAILPLSSAAANAPPDSSMLPASSTSYSQRPISGASNLSTSEGSDQTSTRGSHTLMPPAISRTPSPFQQLMRNTRSRPTSDVPTTGSWQTKPSILSPPLQHSPQASSTSSLHSVSPPLSQQRSSYAGSETPLRKRPSLSYRLSQHLGAVFGEMTSMQPQPSSSSLRDQHARPTSPLESDLITIAMAEASRKLHQPRPPLMRMRSRSLGDMQGVQQSTADIDFAPGKKLGAPMEKSASFIHNEGNSWDDPASSEGREGTLSRLAGSLRRRPKPSQIPVNVLHNVRPPSSAPSWATLTLKHRRTRTNTGPLGVTMSNVGATATDAEAMLDTTPSPAAETPPKLYIDDALETKESWWSTPSADDAVATERSSKDTTFSQFGAAHLALALSSGDDTLEARMEAAGSSPQNFSMALPSVGSRQMPSSPDGLPASSFAQCSDDDLKTATHEGEATEPRPFVGMSRSRSSSPTRALEPDVGRTSVQRDASPPKGYLQEDGLSSGYESAASTLRNFDTATGDNAPQRVASPNSRLRRGLYSDSPPSSFNATRYAHLTTSESASKLVAGDGDGADAGAAVVESTERRGSEATIKLESRRNSGHVRRSSASDALLAIDAQPDTRVSPSPLARIRKLSTPSALSSRRKNAVSEKPELTLDTTMLDGDVLLARPSSAMGMSAHLERNMHHDIQRQPTLSIADDLEFLQALEHVRRGNQDRIKRQREEAVKHAELARFGLAPRSSRKSSGGASGRGAVQQAISSANDAWCNLDADQLTSAALVESPLSEDGPSSSSSSLRRGNVRSMSVSSPHRPSPLELGVGKASGKLRDGAFLNDEDWKKEVKALFVIRELVLTERSYAAYLDALLQAVRHMPMQQPGRRSTTPSLLMTSSVSIISPGSQNSTNNNTALVPPHIVLMRNLLPQLITMSRTLANRIDENPTAAGVGAAFRLVSVQMEATFVAWSAAITEIMQALRASEGPKGKARGRIGLIGIQVEPTPGVTPMSSMSVPSSPVRIRGPLRDNSAKSLIVSPTSAIETEALQLSSDSGGSTSEGGLTKRRSTLSSVTPSMAANIRAKLSASGASPSPTSASVALDDLAMTSRSSKSSSSNSNIKSAAFNEGRRPSAATVASPVARKGGVIGSSNQFLASTSTFLDNALSMSPSSLRPSGTTTPSASHKAATESAKSVELKHSSNGSKKLTAMDVAIMPTQRLPRYLLLLRDLHANTPPQSLSNMRLQRSLDFVHRVAGLCDRASKTAAHCRSPSSGR